MAVKKAAKRPAKRPATRKKPAKKPTAKKAVKDTASKKAAAKRSAAKKASSHEMKTTPTTANVDAFIAAVPLATRRDDAKALLALMKKITGQTPKMWGASIVGFGEYHYKYETGREGDWPITGFAPRGAANVIYVMGGVPENDNLFERLGKHSMGKSCLYIKKLDDVDIGVLEQIIRRSVAYMRARYPG